MHPFEPGPLEIAHLRTKELKAAKGRREGVLIAIPDAHTHRGTAKGGWERRATEETRAGICSSSAANSWIARPRPLSSL